MRTTFEKVLDDEARPIVTHVRVGAFLAFVALALSVSVCGGNSSSPTTPTTSSPPTTATRVIGLTGNLAFGNVAIGQEVSSTITITNSGNAVLTITGMTAPGSVYTASATTGTIGAGGALPLQIFFKPTAAQSYNGTLTVNGNQTSGPNTLPISGTGTTVATTPPATFAVNGTVTDGTSHGILPNITVQIASGTNVGKSAVTDGSGNYVLSGLAAGTFTLSAAATSYQTTTQQVTLSASTRVDLVLQRTTTPPPQPTASARVRLTQLLPIQTASATVARPTGNSLRTRAAAFRKTRLASLTTRKGWGSVCCWLHAR
jgi:hypothetical protein